MSERVTSRYASPSHPGNVLIGFEGGTRLQIDVVNLEEGLFKPYLYGCTFK